MSKYNYKISLLYANKTEEDILLYKELNELKEAGKITLNYTLDQPKDDWKGFKGYVTKDMM